MYFATPRVEVTFSDQAVGSLFFAWDTNSRIYRGSIEPGGAMGDYGDIFPDSNFFMNLDWSNVGADKNHCIQIVPKWPVTRIYIRADGEIDQSSTSGTDSDQLRPCPMRVSEHKQPPAVAEAECNTGCVAKTKCNIPPSARFCHAIYRTQY